MTINKLRTIKTALLNDLDDCKNFKSKLNFDTQFPELMTLTVKEKLIGNFIDVISTLIKWKNENIVKIYLLNQMKVINKRLKIHLVQLEKLKKINNLTGEEIDYKNYYTIFIKLIYKYILKN
jgi:hypothetical protein